MRLPVVNGSMCCYYCPNQTLLMLSDRVRYTDPTAMLYYLCERCLTKFTDSNNGLLLRVEFQRGEHTIRLWPTQHKTDIMKITMTTHGTWYTLIWEVNRILNISPDDAEDVMCKYLVLM